MNTDVEFLHDLRAQIVHLLSAESEATRTSVRRFRTKWLPTPLRRALITLRPGRRLIVGATGAGALAAVLLISYAVAVSSNHNPRDRAATRYLAKQSAVGHDASPAASAPTLGHPFPAGVGRVVNKTTLARIAPWIVLPKIGETAYGWYQPWAATTWIAGARSTIISLFYPHQGLEVTEYPLRAPTTPTAFIRSLHPVFGEVGLKIRLRGAAVFDSKALVVSRGAAFHGYNQVTLVIGRTVAVLFGRMSLRRMEASAASLRPGGLTVRAVLAR